MVEDIFLQTSPTIHMDVCEHTHAHTDNKYDALECVTWDASHCTCFLSKLPQCTYLMLCCPINETVSFGDM